MLLINKNKFRIIEMLLTNYFEKKLTKTKFMIIKKVNNFMFSL